MMRLFPVCAGSELVVDVFRAPEFSLPYEGVYIR